MARLSQSQLAGFRIGNDPPPAPTPPATLPERGPRREQPRPDPPTEATPRPLPGLDGPTEATPARAASWLGPVPAAPTRAEARHKVGITLPVELAEQVRVLTRQGYALADLVMVAYQDHRDALVEEHHRVAARRLVCHPRGRSPLTVALSDAERQALDALGGHLGWTRSHTVAVLLDRQLTTVADGS